MKLLDFEKVSLMISTIFELGLAMYVAKELIEQETYERAKEKNEEMMLERKFRKELEKIYEENI